MTHAITFTSIAAQFLIRDLLAPLIALVLTVAGYTPDTPQLALAPAAAPSISDTLTCTELRALCHQHGIRPGRSRVSAAAALLAAGITA